MSVSLSVPADLLPAFRRFRSDFDQVTRAWIEAGVETVDSVDAARDGLREFLADTADPDEYGVGRVQRLQSLFGHWANLAQHQVPRRKGVVPVLSFEAEARIADVWWKRRKV